MAAPREETEAEEEEEEGKPKQKPMAVIMGLVVMAFEIGMEAMEMGICQYLAMIALGVWSGIQYAACAFHLAGMCSALCAPTGVL